ncbi:lyase family protein [Arthrobacter sp. HMSC08H08]|uniref:lyase family protein n=1 Tax=Arthrobacter sp. HMSC08H08 TaxID=1581143 RepID=UPI000AD3AED6|nr:lyase family protein [Arthrobacter sp. HMSC08H08]
MLHGDYGVLSPAWAGSQAAAITSDHAFVQALLDVEHAWSAVLAEAGLIPQEHLGAITDAADADDYDLAAIAAEGVGGGNPLIPLLGAYRANVAETNPAAASSIHIGATSQDIMDTAMMLIIKRAGEQTLATIRSAAAALVDLAREYRDTPMVARSLTQHSLPATFGWRVTHWLQALAQAGQNLEQTLTQTALQWGGAAGTRASLQDFLTRTNTTVTADELVANLANKLGLQNPPPWQANRIPVLVQADSFAQVAAACGKIANDVLISVRSENGELGEPLAAGRGISSAMPHKQNPVLSVLIKNAALTAPQLLAQVYTGAVANVEERADGGWHTEWEALRGLVRTSGAAVEKTHELVSGLRVFPDRMAQNLARHGELLATERMVAHLAPRLEEHGVADAGQGKKYLQGLISRALTEGASAAGETQLKPLLLAELPAEVVTESELNNLLDPSAYTGDAAMLVDQITSTYIDWSHS